MFCPNCGTKLEDGAVFCTSCGVRIAQDTPTPVQPEQPADSAQQPPQSEAPVQQPAPAEQPDIWHQAANDAPEDTWQQPAQDQQPPFEQPIVTNTMPGGAAPKDYLVVNIVLTMLCFLCCSCINFFGLITGIIGIVSSSQVRKAVAAGDLALADQKSRTAKAMMIATAVIFGLAVIMSIILVATGALQGAMDELVYGSWS